MTSNTMSGSDQRAFNWSRIFSARHYPVNVFTSVPGAERFKSMGLKVYVTGKVYLKSNIGLFLVYLYRAFRGCLLQFKIKPVNEGVIYSSSDLLADAVPAIFMKFRNNKFKLLVGMHLIAPNPFKGFKKLYTQGVKLPSAANLYYFFFQRGILSALKRMASLVLVSNQSDRAFLIKKGFDQDKVLVTYGASDVSCSEAVLNEEKTYDALYIGRFHEQKGFPDLLAIWKDVVRQLPKVKLAVMGEDITAQDVKTYIRQNHLERNIDFLGYVGGTRKYGYIKSSKICIFPSYYESFGIVALEAMTCGVPVLAYDLPVFREIYVKGMLRLPIGDIEGMAQKAIELIENNGERRLIGKEALDISKQFSWDKTAQDILGKLGL